MITNVDPTNTVEWWEERAERFEQKNDLRDNKLEFPILAKLITGPVLEVGCAFGMFCKYLPPTVQYCGVDISPTMIKRARVLFPERLFVVSDFQDLQLRSHSDSFPFREAVCCQTLEHFWDPKVLIRWFRGLASTRLVFTIPRGKVSEAQARDDGHKTGWETADDLVRDWSEFGRVELLEIKGSKHFCGSIEWKSKCLERSKPCTHSES